MSIDLEQRVTHLEQEMDDLKKSIQANPREKDWRRTFGMSKGDAGFDEMIRLGQEIRQQDRGDAA